MEARHVQLVEHGSGLRRRRPPVQELDAAPPMRLRRGTAHRAVSRGMAAASTSSTVSQTRPLPSHQKVGNSVFLIASAAPSRRWTVGAYSMRPKSGCRDRRSGRTGDSVRRLDVARYRPFFAPTHRTVRPPHGRRTTRGPPVPGSQIIEPPAAATPLPLPP